VIFISRGTQEALEATGAKTEFDVNVAVGLYITSGKLQCVNNRVITCGKVSFWKRHFCKTKLPKCNHLQKAIPKFYKRETPWPPFNDGFLWRLDSQVRSLPEISGLLPWSSSFIHIIFQFSSVDVS